MKRLIFKRLLLLIPLVLGVSLICFTLINLNPSNPAEVTLRVNNITPTNEAILEMQKELGLDKPLYQRYIYWLKDILKADFGNSYETKEPVLNEILQAFPTTLYLTFCSLFLIITVGFSIGVICAIYEGHWIDRTLRIFTFVCTSVPSFWLALLLIWLFSIKFDLLPTGGLEDINSIILPSITLAISYIGTFIRIMRNSLVQIKQSLFISYAKARGLKKHVILKHQIRNALQPFIIALNMSIPRLLAGTVIVENIFGLPGVGRLCIQAIFNRDYPMIQAYILFMAVLFILFNLFADIWVQIRDPRLRRCQ